MATKITLLAQDIKVGTEIVQFALTIGAAIMEYGECDSPLAAKPKKKARKKDKEARYGGGYAVVGDNEFQTGSLRFRGMESLRNLDVVGDLTRIGWTRALAESGQFEEKQAKSIVSGLIKSGNLEKAA